jgi:hypothetical protein
VPERLYSVRAAVLLAVQAVHQCEQLNVKQYVSSSRHNNFTFLLFTHTHARARAVKETSLFLVHRLIAVTVHCYSRQQLDHRASVSTAIAICAENGYIYLASPSVPLRVMPH